MIGYFLQGGQAAFITLDGDNIGTLGEKGTREAARAGTNFIYQAVGELPGDGGDPGQQLPVQDEILAECLARRQPVPRNDLAQRLRAVVHADKAR